MANARAPLARVLDQPHHQVLVPLYSKAADFSSTQMLKSSALALMAAICLVGRRTFFLAEFSSFLTKRVVLFPFFWVTFFSFECVISSRVPDWCHDHPPSTMGVLQTGPPRA